MKRFIELCAGIQAGFICFILIAKFAYSAMHYVPSKGLLAITMVSIALGLFIIGVLNNRPLQRACQRHFSLLMPLGCLLLFAHVLSESGSVFRYLELKVTTSRYSYKPEYLLWGSSAISLVGVLGSYYYDSAVRPLMDWLSARPSE